MKFVSTERGSELFFLYSHFNYWEQGDDVYGNPEGDVLHELFMDSGMSSDLTMNFLNDGVLPIRDHAELHVVGHYGLEILKRSKKGSKFNKNVQKSLVGFLETALDVNLKLIGSHRFPHISVEDILDIVDSWSDHLDPSWLFHLVRNDFFTHFSIVISVDLCSNRLDGYTEMMGYFRQYAKVLMDVENEIKAQNDKQLNQKMLLGLKPLVTVLCEMLQMIEEDFSYRSRFLILGPNFDDVNEIICMVLDTKTPDTKAFCKFVTSGCLKTLVKMQQFLKNELNGDDNTMLGPLGSIQSYLHKFGHMFSAKDMMKMVPWILDFIRCKSIQQEKAKFYWHAALTGNLMSLSHLSQGLSMLEGPIERNEPFMAASAVKFLSSPTISDLFNDERRKSYFQKLSETGAYKIFAEFIIENFADSDSTRCVLDALSDCLFATDKGTSFPLENFSELLPLMLNFMKRTKSMSKKKSNSGSHKLNLSVVRFLPLFIRTMSIEKLRELDEAYTLIDTLLQNSSPQDAPDFLLSSSVLVMELFRRLGRTEKHAHCILSYIPHVWHLIPDYTSKSLLNCRKVNYFECCYMFLDALSTVFCHPDEKVQTVSEDMVLDCIEKSKLEYSGPSEKLHVAIFKIAWYWIRKDQSDAFTDYLNQLSSSGAQTTATRSNINKESIYLFLCNKMNRYIDFQREQLDKIEKTTDHNDLKKAALVNDFFFFTNEMVEIVSTCDNNEELYALEDIISPLIWSIDGVEHEKIVNNVKDFISVLR